MKTITPDALSETLGRPGAPLLVDVLGAGAATGPARAVNVPYGPDFVKRFTDTLDAPDQPVLVFGSSAEQERVREAARALEEAGYKKVQCYLGDRADFDQLGGDVSTQSPEARIGKQPKPIIAGVAEPGGAPDGRPV